MSVRGHNNLMDHIERMVETFEQPFARAAGGLARNARNILRQFGPGSAVIGRFPYAETEVQGAQFFRGSTNGLAATGIPGILLTGPWVLGNSGHIMHFIR